MNFAPISYSQFKCCPGHPYSFPDKYVTPLVCQWQQPDFRPIHFGNETRFTSKTGNNCIPPARYEYTTRVAVVAFHAGNERQAAQIKHLANDISIDRIYVVVTGKECKYDFIRRFKNNFKVRSKVVRTYIRTRNDQVGLTLFAARYLQGEITTLFV